LNLQREKILLQMKISLMEMSMMMEKLKVIQMYADP